MVPTIRLVRFIALGSPLWLLSFVFPAGWAAAVVYLLVLGAVCFLDYRSIPDASALEIKRDFGRFALGRMTDMRVLLKNRSKQFIELSVRDELPSGLEQLASIPEAHLPGSGECEFA